MTGHPLTASLCSLDLTPFVPKYLFYIHVNTSWTGLAVAPYLPCDLNKCSPECHQQTMSIKYNKYKILCNLVNYIVPWRKRCRQSNVSRDEESRNESVREQKRYMWKMISDLRLSHLNSKILIVKKGSRSLWLYKNWHWDDPTSFALITNSQAWPETMM